MDLKQSAKSAITFYRSILSVSQPACNICGGTRFVRGPSRRLSITGKFPRCLKCKSCERHRIQRKIAEKIAKHFDLRNEFSALQFSTDQSFNANWFKSFEKSEYDGSNHIDVQAIDRANNSFDLIIINHVLEHVKEDKKALLELLRITSPIGFIFLSVPNTAFQEKTEDWGYPREELHGHYRHYGKDFSRRIEEACPNGYWLRVMESDDSTSSYDEVYLISKSRETVAKLNRLLNISNF